MGEGTNQCDGCRRGLLVRDGIHYDRGHHWMACTAPRARPFYPTFDAYVAEHPEGERFRRWLTNDGRRNVVLFLGRGSYNHLPGGYLWACIIEQKDAIWVHANDSDDDLVTRTVASRAEAEAVLDELAALAPASLGDLLLFGFDY